MVGGFERDQPTGLGGQPLPQGRRAELTDAFIHNQAHRDGPIEKAIEVKYDSQGKQPPQAI